MFGELKKQLLTSLAAAAKEVVCEKCGRRFRPFAGQELSSFADLKNASCPHCGHHMPTVHIAHAAKDAGANPPGPFTRPEESRIERRPVSASELLFYIPATGRWGGLLFFAIFWNAIAWTVFLVFAFRAPSEEDIAVPAFVTAIFPVIGIGLAYMAARTRFAIHLLYLSPELVRLQRTLFRHSKNHDLPAAEIVHVKKAEFYRQNYRPVYGIEIAATKRKIRFGSMLTDDEKNWLCWEIREFLRSQGVALPPEAALATNDDEETLVRPRTGS